MKKLLLLAALTASFATANAKGLGDCFKLSYEGEPIADGQTVVVSNYYDDLLIEYPELAGAMTGNLKCVAEIFATNVTEEPVMIEFSLNVIIPTEEEFAGGEYGNYQLCYYFESGAGNCLPESSIKDFYSVADPVSAEEYIRLDIDQIKFTDLAPVTLQLDVRAIEDDEVTDTSTIYINFTHERDITMAVDGIEATSGVSEYFNLQGVRISEPQKGQIVIERKGGKTAKRIF